MFKQTSLGKAADEARLHQQWRELSNQTINDSDLRATRTHAEAAPTDLLKRQRMRAYYAKAKPLPAKTADFIEFLEASLPR